MKSVGILLCAGSSDRMGVNKLLMEFGGKTVMERSFNTFLDAGIQDIIITISDATFKEAERLSQTSRAKVCIAKGGNTRQQSVYRALTMAKGAFVAVIHDAARCLVQREIIISCIESAKVIGVCRILFIISPRLLYHIS